jgi:hypothetical protein
VWEDDDGVGDGPVLEGVKAPKREPLRLSEGELAPSRWCEEAVELAEEPGRAYEDRELEGR